MSFKEFLDIILDKKIEFIYKDKYYNFNCTKSYDFNTELNKGDVHYFFMVHGQLKFWTANYICDNTATTCKLEYIDFVKNLTFNDMPLSYIINNGLYKEGSFRIIPEVIKKEYYSRNINTIAESLFFNYINMDASVEYLDVSIGIYGGIKGCDTTPNYLCNYNENDFDNLSLVVTNAYITEFRGTYTSYKVDLKEKEISEVRSNPDKDRVFGDVKYYGYDIVAIKTEKMSDADFDTINDIYSKYIYVEYKNIDNFFAYLHKVKIKGVLLKDILEKGLYDGVEMAI